MTSNNQPAPAQAGADIAPPRPASSIISNAIPFALMLAFVGFMFLPQVIPVESALAFAALAGLDLSPADLFWLNPVLSAALGIVIGGVIGGVSGWFRHKNTVQRLAALQQLAGGLGARFLPSADAELTAKLNPIFPDSLSVGFSNVLLIESGGVHIAVGDVSYTIRVQTSKSSRTRTTHQTLALLDAGALTFPEFTLQPEGFMIEALSKMAGIEDIDFPAHSQFSKTYHLSAVHAENTRRLFDEPLLTALEGTQGLCLKAARSSLVLYRPGRVVGPDKLKAFVMEAGAILRQFYKSARSAAAAADLAPARKTDVKALVKDMPGVMGKMLRENLVVRADLEAFLRQAPPRAIPPNIRKNMNDFASFFLPFGLILAAVGLVMTWILASKSGWSMEVSFPVAAVAVGICIVWFAARSLWRTKRLLRHGQTANARISVIESTGVRTNNVEDYRMLVVYQAGGREVQASCKIQGDAVLRANKLKTEGKPASILYDPGNTQTIVYTDSLLCVSPEYEP